MKRAVFVIATLAAGAVALAASLAADRAPPAILAQAAAPPAATPAAAAKPLPDNPGFYAGEAGLSPSEIAGREIWYKATGGNARFHTYVFQQRVGRAGRLVPRPACRPARRPLRRVGSDQRPGLLHARLGRTARRRAWTRPTASTGARATRSCSSSSAAKATAIRRAISATRRSTRTTRTAAPRTSASRRAISPSAPPPARSATASFRIRASTAPAGRS